LEHKKVKLLLNATIVELFDSHLSNKTNNIWGLLDQTAIFTVEAVCMMSFHRCAPFYRHCKCFFYSS